MRCNAGHGDTGYHTGNISLLIKRNICSGYWVYYTDSFRTEAFIPIPLRRVLPEVMPPPQGQPASNDWSTQSASSRAPCGVSWDFCCNFVSADCCLWPILTLTRHQFSFLRALTNNPSAGNSDSSPWLRATNRSKLLISWIARLSQGWAGKGHADRAGTDNFPPSLGSPDSINSKDDDEGDDGGYRFAVPRSPLHVLTNRSLTTTLCGRD